MYSSEKQQPQGRQFGIQRASGVPTTNRNTINNLNEDSSAIFPSPQSKHAPSYFARTPKDFLGSGAGPDMSCSGPLLTPNSAAFASTYDMEVNNNNDGGGGAVGQQPQPHARPIHQPRTYNKTRRHDRDHDDDDDDDDEDSEADIGALPGNDGRTANARFNARFNADGAVDLRPSLNSGDSDHSHGSATDLKKKRSLGYHYSLVTGIFWVIVLVSTMLLFIYSNQSDGAFVQVQVTPMLPSLSGADAQTPRFTLMETVTPWRATLMSYGSSTDTNPITATAQKTPKIDQIRDILIAFFVEIQELQAKYPSLQLTDANDNAIHADSFANVTQRLLDYYYADNYYLLNDDSDHGKKHDGNNDRDVVVKKSDDNTIKADVFHFTLTSSINDFWQSEAYELAFIIATFSGAWPYLKILLLLCLWLQPLTSQRRSNTLLILDQLGKFSFIDLYVMVFMCVSFYMTITEATATMGVVVAVVVQIDVGVTTFAIGTLVSMFYSMVFIFMDDAATRNVIRKTQEKTSMLLLRIAYYSDQMRKQPQKPPQHKVGHHGDYIQPPAPQSQPAQDMSVYMHMDDAANNRQKSNPFVTENEVQYNSGGISNPLASEQRPPQKRMDAHHAYDANRMKLYENGHWLHNIQHLTLADYDKYMLVNAQANVILDDADRAEKLRQIKLIAKWYESHVIENDGYILHKRSKIYAWKMNRTHRSWALLDLPKKSMMAVLCRCIFLTCVVANIYLCVATIYSAPVRYDMLGLAGWAVDDGIRTFSIKETADKLPSSTDMKEAAYFCQIQYYATVILFPVFISGLIAVVWLWPMTYSLHRKLMHVMLPIQAWAALDVFLIGTVAASVELDEVSQWIIDTNFASICGPKGYVQNIFGLGCFSVQGTLTYGSIMLGAWVAFNWFSVIYTAWHIRHAYKELGK